MKDLFANPWFLFGGIIFLALLRTWLRPLIHGKAGEAAVGVRLASLGDEYFVLHDLTIPVQGRTTQIDHVVVSPYGIFVIETKNYKGWIFGTDQSESWTQNIYGKKYSLHNPVKQNYGHIKALEEVLNLDYKCFIPIVTFTARSVLKTKTKAKVIYTHHLMKEIRSYHEEKLNEEQIAEVREKLAAYKTVSHEQVREHVKNVRTTINDNKQKIRQGICPKCGGKLILKNGKYGAFYGCSNYPKCRFTQQK